MYFITDMSMYNMLTLCMSSVYYRSEQVCCMQIWVHGC